MAKSTSSATNKGDRDKWTQTMLDRAKKAFAHDTEQRRKTVDDMKFTFIAGNQWDAHLTALRHNRPCYEFNRVRGLVRRVTGMSLKNKPQIKVRATEDNDTDTADVYNGLIKNIEVQSSAENGYDSAMQWATAGGFGILAVTSDYESDDSFDQRLVIQNVMDPMHYWPDPDAKEFDRSDARYWFVDELVSREEFKERWPTAEMVDFEASPAKDSYAANWAFSESVRIAVYWYIEKEEKTIHLLSDGSIVSAEEFDPIADEMASNVGPNGEPQEPVTVKDSRKVMKPCVYSCLVSGKGKLEEPVKWGGSMIPIVPQWGDFLSVDGTQHFSGMTRFGKDAQTVHNFEVSTMVEVIAKQPNSPLMATPAMVKGFESFYSRMGYEDPPVMLYNHDPLAPGGRPTREPPPVMPVAMASVSQIMTDELKAALGVYDASLGAQSNESSGRAIIARQNEGEVANFVYGDNQVKALKRLGDILVDAIPHYYDADRSIRILGEDGAEKYVRINQPVRDEQTGEVIVKNDLSRGKYDVTVTVGKSFDTARMEMAEVGQVLAAQPGPIGMIGQFMMLKSIDAPGMDEAIKAARRVLVGQGLLEPDQKAGEQPPAPPPPNPKDVADAEKSKADAAKIKAQTDGIELDNAGKAAALQTFGLPVDANGPTGPGALVGTAPGMAPDPLAAMPPGMGGDPGANGGMPPNLPSNF